MIYAIIAFGLLVFIHEFGHFITAIIFGVKVEKFSLGMGPAFLSFSYKQTIYQIGIIPFGGFCQFKEDSISEDLPMQLSRSQMDSLQSFLNSDLQTIFHKLYIPDEMDQSMYKLSLSNVSPVDKELLTKTLYKCTDMRKYRNKESFFGINSLKRMIIAFAGPFMNYLLAVLLIMITLMISHREIHIPSKIIVSEDFNGNSSSAYRHGIRTGDTIISINGSMIKSFSDISENMMLLSGKKLVTVTVLRNNQQLSFEVIPDWDKDNLKPLLGVIYYNEPYISITNDSFLAAALDLKQGDKIISINGSNELVTDITVNNFLQSNFKTNTTGYFDVLRNNEVIRVHLDFMSLSLIKDSKKQFYLNFVYPEDFVKGKSFPDSLFSSIRESNKIIKLTYTGLYSLFFRPKGDIKEQLGGPIKIGYFVKNITDSGFNEGFLTGIRSFFHIVSYISLALAFFNLLPFPALDGGYIVLSIYEIITRKAVRLKYIGMVNLVGFVILISLGILVAFFDIQFLGKI